MAWQLTGDLIEACSCNVFCPCWYGAPEVALPDKGIALVSWPFACETAILTV